VKQRTGMIIFAAAGRISPVAGRVTGTGTAGTGWGFCEVFLYLLLFDFIEMFYFIFSIFFWKAGNCSKNIVNYRFRNFSDTNRNLLFDWPMSPLILHLIWVKTIRKYIISFVQKKNTPSIYWYHLFRDSANSFIFF
jgi:hypothetical protein